MRHGWRMRIREGMEAEYRRVHADVFPDLLDAIAEAGLRNYTLFVDGRDVFSYFECDDLAAAQAILADHPAEKRWQEANGHLLDKASGGPVVLDEIFHTEGAKADG